MSTKNSYRNPFEGINASKLDDQAILEYWCSPFSYKSFAGIKESDIFSEPTNIVIMGGRSTGKTMFLRFWSYQVQLKKAKEALDKAEINRLADHFQELGGMGLYIRIDGPVLRSFEEFAELNPTWQPIFVHYFELITARAYVEAIIEMIQHDMLSLTEVDKNFVPQIGKLLGTDSSLTTIEQILNEIDDQVRYLDEYRGAYPFFKTDFKPKKGFASQSLSFGIPKIAFKTIPEFKDKFNFTLLIDEYENFSEVQQRMINTLIKFTSDKINFRIGMRLEGFRTFSTTSTDDFIKEGREYRKIIFDDVLIKDKDYRDFLIEVSRKRLERVEVFSQSGKTDILKFLGNAESLEEEAIELTAKDPGRHFKLYDVSKHLTEEELALIKHPENPLLEMLNILWLIRGVSLAEINTAMDDFIAKKSTRLGDKYKMDYTDKYKLSLMILLASVYRKNKKYYSFNTFSFLSSGIIGHFIELCRITFSNAAFEDRDGLINDGLISKDVQNKAAKQVSDAELQQLPRIEINGSLIYRFISNIGNIFRDFHKDEKIKYPETNQFTTDYGAIEEIKYKKAFQDAIKWSAIQRKTSLQQPAPGKHLKDIYTINRIFSPSFQISYRTRGGYSVPLMQNDIIYLMTQEEIKTSKYLMKGNKKKGQEGVEGQSKLFN